MRQCFLGTKVFIRDGNGNNNYNLKVDKEKDTIGERVNLDARELPDPSMHWARD